MIVNNQKKFCYRITHRENLGHIFRYGLVTKNHADADMHFVSIGNPEIIDIRGSTNVKLDGYGYVGDYVPFYFTPRSIMLFNIVTGYYAPKVPKRDKDEIVVIRCLIEKLSQQPKWFFTDGQANDWETTHYNDLDYLDKIDWNCIQTSNFVKSVGDYDLPRRYQAEFLVQNKVPVDCIESICVYSESMKTWAKKELGSAGLNIPVYSYKPYFFD